MFLLISLKISYFCADPLGLSGDEIGKINRSPCIYLCSITFLVKSYDHNLIDTCYPFVLTEIDQQQNTLFLMGNRRPLNIEPLIFLISLELGD